MPARSAVRDSERAHSDRLRPPPPRQQAQRGGAGLDPRGSAAAPRPPRRRAAASGSSMPDGRARGLAERSPSRPPCSTRPGRDAPTARPGHRNVIARDEPEHELGALGRGQRFVAGDEHRRIARDDVDLRAELDACAIDRRRRRRRAARAMRARSRPNTARQLARRRRSWPASRSLSASVIGASACTAGATQLHQRAELDAVVLVAEQRPLIAAERPASAARRRARGAARRARPSRRRRCRARPSSTRRGTRHRRGRSPRWSVTSAAPELGSASASRQPRADRRRSVPRPVLRGALDRARRPRDRAARASRALATAAAPACRIVEVIEVEPREPRPRAAPRRRCRCRAAGTAAA